MPNSDFSLELATAQIVAAYVTRADQKPPRPAHLCHFIEAVMAALRKGSDTTGALPHGADLWNAATAKADKPEKAEKADEPADG